MKSHCAFDLFALEPFPSPKLYKYTEFYPSVQPLHELKAITSRQCSIKHWWQRGTLWSAGSWPFFHHCSWANEVHKLSDRVHAPAFGSISNAGLQISSVWLRVIRSLLTPQNIKCLTLASTEHSRQAGSFLTLLIVLSPGHRKYVHHLEKSPYLVILFNVLILQWDEAVWSGQASML